ncbi:CYTH-like domain-containing protein [Apiospora arundinis]|uniref:CYTH-like domain-containing protein n=1 Tax=Apiospora arundinis TaxID=335852 RepID=A0ABR2I9R6_9PEZI
MWTLQHNLRQEHPQPKNLAMLHIFAQCRQSSSSFSRHARLASTSSSKDPIRRLEVERKFRVTPEALSSLRSDNRRLTFHSCYNLGKATTHNIYYDRDGLLFSKGVYVRRRDGRWEAKIRAGGDYINSAFMEIDGIQAVERAVKNIMVLPGFRSDLEEMLVPCADFVTDRESWMIDGKFKVDVDSTDFSHIIYLF